MSVFKKRNNKETKKVPMTGKAAKGYRTYCAIVLCMAFVMCLSVTAFAAGANDLLTVINNLSDFIFGLICAIGLSLKSHDLSQRANGFLTLAGGVIITLQIRLSFK